MRDQFIHTTSYLQNVCSSSIDTSVSLSVFQLGDWVCEKMLMARDSSRDETQKLHKKWLKHQAFMAELAQNKEWLDKIEKVSAAPFKRKSFPASQIQFWHFVFPLA